MGKAKAQGRGVHNGHDPERHLRQKDDGHQVEGAPGQGMRRSPAPPPDDGAEDQRQVTRHPVHELHEARVFEESPPGRATFGHIKGIGRKEAFAHQRPGRKGPARVDPGDQRAKKDLHEGKVHEPGGKREKLALARTARLHELRLGARQRQRVPGDKAKDREGEPQMRGKTVGGDIDHPPAQPGGNHPPADRTLQPAKNPKAQKPPGPAGRNAAGRPEEKEAHGPDNADHPAKLAVAPFPPEDRLEGGKVHVAVLKPVFGAGLVLREFHLPVGIAQGWQRAGHRAPFGDRQPAVGQPRQPAHRDHRDDKREKDEKPNADRAARPALACVDHAALRRDAPWFRTQRLQTAFFARPCASP